MIRAAAEHTAPDGNSRKAWRLYLYATGAYIFVQSDVYNLRHLLTTRCRIAPQNLALKPSETKLTSAGRDKQEHNVLLHITSRK